MSNLNDKIQKLKLSLKNMRDFFQETSSNSSEKRFRDSLLKNEIETWIGSENDSLETCRKIIIEIINTVNNILG